MREKATRQADGPRFEAPDPMHTSASDKKKAKTKQYQSLVSTNRKQQALRERKEQHIIDTCIPRQREDEKKEEEEEEQQHQKRKLQEQEQHEDAPWKQAHCA